MIHTRIHGLESTEQQSMTEEIINKRKMKQLICMLYGRKQKMINVCTSSKLALEL